MKPDRNQWNEWKDSPVTQWVMQELNNMAKQYAEDMGYGSTLDINSTERTALITAQNVGFIDGITAINRIEVERDESDTDGPQSPYKT